MSLEFQVLLPEEYLIKHVETGVRPDGRKLTDRRPFSISSGNIKSADGSAIAKQGNTTVVCGIKAELAKPTAENPNNGFIVPNMILSPLCHPAVKAGPPSPAAQELSAFLKDVIMSSECVKLTDLCPVPGRFAWVLYIDLLCLDHDGNLKDAAVAALVAALNSLKLPDITFDEELEQISVSQEKTDLKIHSSPVCCSHSVFYLESGSPASPGGTASIVSDPTYKEEEVADSTLSIVLLDKDEICLTHQTGSRPLSEASLQSAISLASEQSTKIRKAVNDLR